VKMIEALHTHIWNRVMKPMKSCLKGGERDNKE
jgi:hypothetical protein